MNLRLLPLALAAAFAATAAAAAPRAAAPAAPAWPQAISDIPADPDTRFGILPNGMRYALRHNQTPPHQISFRLRIDAGSLDEREDQRGLAHFIEHMVFNGTTHVPEGEFVHRLERHGLSFGADTNASTEFDQTVYKLDFPENDAASIDDGLFLLREVASEASFGAAAIDRERGIIQSEERSRATPAYRNLVDRLGFALRGQLLPQRLPIGDPQVVATARRDRFLALYNAYYRPERATLVVVGDFNVDEMEARIRNRFASWQGRGPAGAAPDLGRVAPRVAEAHVLVEPGGGTQVSLIWTRAPDLRPDTRAVRAEQLADALALQILNRRLERIATTASPRPFIAAQAAHSDVAHSADLVQIVAASQDDWRPALTTIENEQRRLVEHGVSAAEIAREVEQVRSALSAMVAGAATRQSVALSEGLVGAVDRNDVSTSPAEALREFEAAVPGLTPARLQQSAASLFAGEPLIAMTAPTAPEGGEAALLARYRTAHAVPVGAATVRQAQAWPYTGFGPPGAVVERHDLPQDLGATAVRFANGVRLTVKHTDFANDQILVSVRFGRGQLDLPRDRPSPSWALGPAFQAGGLGRLSFEDMDEALNSRTYGVSLGIDEDAFQLSGTSRPVDFATQMQVLAAYVVDPGWRPTGWDRMRSLGGAIQNQLAATPSGVFNRDANPLLHDGDRRWALPTQAQMEASTIADARNLLAGPLAHAPIEVIIVGDVDVEQAIRQTAATFGALPPRGTLAPSSERIRFPAPTAAPVRFTHRGRADQGLAYIAWPTLGFYDNPRDARALTVLASVYQLRLTQRIREEQGTTYSPQAFHNPSEAYAGYGTFGGTIEARPEALAGFLRDAQVIAADLRDHPVGADELQRARLPMIEAVQRARQGNAWWLDELENIQTDPRVAARLESQIADYQAVTPADLQRVARQYLRPGGAWQAVVVPETPAQAS